ncbi:hypothetical protein F5I97DRAFT_878647 [Phlebopus sp. FC_14]|nr:hypothetical protein F5I97DRAFT_878647 [Phlebopus sp. FC_14]
MSLFTDHPFRHVLKAIVALVMGHMIMRLLPRSIQVVHLTQTSVTVLAIAALIFFVRIDVDLAHPRHLFSPSSGTAETNVVGAGGRRAPAAYGERNPPSQRAKTGYRREHPCKPYDEYCVTEEWAFY